MPTLYSYCIPYDNGAAPNPFLGVCTLVICKPVIRRTAKKGDWIVGTGSMQNGFANRVVYAMEVTQTMTMQEYDEYCKDELPGKIPNWNSEIFEEKVGDCIYDFSRTPPVLRRSVHNEGNRERDLGGECALLSDHFYYFGNKPLDLPVDLLGIVKQGQGHKSISNAPHFRPFIDWIIEKKWAKNNVHSEPQSKHLFITNDNYKSECAIKDKVAADIDEEIEVKNYC